MPKEGTKKNTLSKIPLDSRDSRASSEDFVVPNPMKQAPHLSLELSEGKAKAPQQIFILNAIAVQTPSALSRGGWWESAILIPYPKPQEMENAPVIEKSFSPNLCGEQVVYTPQEKQSSPCGDLLSVAGCVCFCAFALACCDNF